MSTTTTTTTPEYVQRTAPTVAVALSEQRIRGEKPAPKKERR